MFDYSPAISGGKQSGFGHGVRPGQVRGGLLGETAAHGKPGMKRRFNRGCERVRLLLVTKCGFRDIMSGKSPNFSCAFIAH